MSAARAYLSDRSAREQERAKGYPPDWKAWAEAEARRIVGEVEPSHGRNGTTVYLNHWYFSGLTSSASRQDATGRAIMALRDTLSAWLSLPSCAVCGAPFDHGCNIGVCSEACEDEANTRGMQ